MVDKKEIGTTPEQLVEAEERIINVCLSWLASWGIDVLDIKLGDDGKVTLEWEKRDE